MKYEHKFEIIELKGRRKPLIEFFPELELISKKMVKEIGVRLRMT